MPDTNYVAAVRAAENLEDLDALCVRHANAPVANSVTGTDERNAARALLAATGLVSYAKRCRTSNDEFEVLIADLMCDLRHLVDALSVEWDQVQHRVESNYAEECGGA